MMRPALGQNALADLVHDFLNMVKFLSSPLTPLGLSLNGERARVRGEATLDKIQPTAYIKWVKL